MKPQQQLRKTANGDCMRACVATLLNIDINKVPDFTEAPDIPNSPYPPFWMALQSWLADKGLFFLEMALPENQPWRPLPIPALSIFFGETAAGVKHAVIGRLEHDQFVQVFNPWPGADLAGIGTVGFIIPRDPSMPVNFGRSIERIQQMASKVPGPIFDAIKTECDDALNRNAQSLDTLIANGKEHPEGH